MTRGTEVLVEFVADEPTDPIGHRQSREENRGSCWRH